MTNAGTRSTRRFKCADLEFDLPHVSPEIDAAYDALYGQVLEAGKAQWFDFNAAVERFVRTKPSPTAMNDFFEAATGAWKCLVDRRAFTGAEAFWARVVDSVTIAENAAGSVVHKGAGYYYWGCSAFQLGTDERGLLLMHEALVEDGRTPGTLPGAWPNTSATAVVTLDAELVATHPANWWVADQAGAINTALAGFGTKLTAADLRRRLFLNTEPANVFLFVYAHASLLRLVRTPQRHRDNDFVGRLVLGHMFHLAVVIERAITSKSGVTGLFKFQAEALSKKIGGRMHEKFGSKKTRAHNINDQQILDADATLRALLSNTALYGGQPVAQVDRCLCIAYVLRNLGGHQSSAPAIVAEKPDELRTEMLGALATCVGAYYP